jgi:hypothetical protein
MQTPSRRFDIARAITGCWVLAMLALCVPAVASAAHPPVAARAGLEIATAAAQSWSQDAVLVYLENDEDVDASGSASRWGYLFYSPSTQKARAYSVRNGRILVAENLGMKFEAPPVAAGWIDSGAAIEAAGREVTHALKQQPGVRLSTMLLMRGAFDDVNPDHTTWTLIYTVPNAPSLFVVVDATEGKVRRTWRG